MRNEQKLRGTEKVKCLGSFIPFKGKQIQKVYEPIEFLEKESNRNVGGGKLSIEIKSKMKQVKAEGAVISNALGLD